MYAIGVMLKVVSGNSLMSSGSDSGAYTSGVPGSIPGQGNKIP